MGFLQSLKGLEQELKDSVTDESSPFSSREGSAMYPPHTILHTSQGSKKLQNLLRKISYFNWIKELRLNC